jgi:hypothetical protein
MSDATKQSIDKCTYRHEWRKEHGEHPIPRVRYVCATCGYRPKEDSKLWHEAESIVHLRTILKPGDTVYTVLRHVSRSGMSRNVDLYVIEDGNPMWVSAYVGHAIGTPQSRKNWELTGADGRWMWHGCGIRTRVQPRPRVVAERVCVLG